MNGPGPIQREGNVGNFQMWLAIGVLFLFIGIPQLVNQGIGEGKPLGIVAGLVFLAGAGLSFYQAYAEKRRADEKTQADEKKQAGEKE